MQQLEPLEQFWRYAEAVNADRYRVTSIRMLDDGSKKTLILDKKDGITRGFTPQEIEQHMPEMVRLERRGENIYYTPLSDKKHHILIDDMSRTGLEWLIDGGYRPAVVIESSPGSYQAIITIPKLGTPYDKDVGNRLTEKLNQQYGDPGLSGAIHPHRAPGFQNRKPKHRREDGTYPVVRLLKAERRECAETLKRSQLLYEVIVEEQQQQAAAGTKKMRRAASERAEHSSPGAVWPSLEDAVREAIRAYKRHHWHVCNLLSNLHYSQENLSRIDSMIALRLRATGHTQAAIEAAILHCAPQIRIGTDRQEHDWPDYARRTAAWAFSPDATKQLRERLWCYVEQWRNIEERAAA